MALFHYTGDYYYGMNNHCNPDADEDKIPFHQVEDFQEKAYDLDQAIRKKSKAHTALLWRGSNVNYPEDATDSGSRFTSASRDPEIAAGFALGLVCNSQTPVSPAFSDGQIPNASGMQLIRVTVPIPFVGGKIAESEYIFPHHVRMRFLKYTLVDRGVPFGEDKRPLIFLTRVYEFMGLAELSSKKMRIAACVSCAQPATHVCSGCQKAYYCSHRQCKDLSLSHLKKCSF